MAYDIFSGTDESAAPAKTPAAASGGGSYDIFSGSVKAPAAPKTPAPINPVDTTGFFGSTLKSLGLSAPVRVANSTPATMSQVPQQMPNYLKNGPVLGARVGENMTPEATGKAYDTIAMNAQGAPGQDIKVPGIDVGISVPSANGTEGGMGGKNAVYDQFKAFIEAPEKAARSLTELVGTSKQDSAARVTRYVVPSYAETAGKTTGQLIDEGVPPTAAVILGSASAAGSFANDALMYEGILASGVRAVTSKAAVPAESHLVAWDYLGRPKTMAEAEANWRTFQREYHPDLVGGDANISKQANNAITIIRKEGIPNSSKVQQAIDAITNRPIKDLFKKTDTAAGGNSQGTIKGFLEDQATQQARADKLQTEIKHYADEHGPDVTRQAIMDNLGLSVSTADRLVTRAVAARTPAEIKAANDMILQEIVPESVPTPRVTTPAVQPESTVTKPADERVKTELPKLVDEYIKKNDNVINTDDARELFDEYNKDRTKSADVHEAASTVAKAAYEKKLTTKQGTGNNAVLFTAGGTGSGKTTALQNAGIIAKEYPIIFDTNMNKFDSAVEKINKALDHGFEVDITYVHNDIKTALGNALSRSEGQAKEFGSGRTVPLIEHINTHVGGVDVLPRLAEHYKDNEKVSFRVIDNEGNINKGSVAKPIDFIKTKVYSKSHEELHSELSKHVEKEHAEKRISKATREGFIGRETNRPNGERDVSKSRQVKGVKKKPGITTTKKVVAKKVVAKKVTTKSPETKMYRTSHEYGIEKMVKGEPVQLVDGVETFIHKEPTGYVVSEVTTGRYLAEGSTKEIAIKKAEFNIEFVGKEKFLDLIAKNKLPNSEVPSKPIVSDDPMVPVQAPKPTPTVATENSRVPKLTQRIQAKLKETLEDVPAYEGMNMQEQAKMAADIIANDYARAKRIALGIEAPPEGLRIGTMFKAVEEEAVANGDVELQRQLGTSATTKVASAYGQEIKAFDGRDPFSPVQAITDVSKAREKAFDGRIKNTTIKKAKAAEIAKIKSAMKKTAPTKETWESFIDSITC